MCIAVAMQRSWDGPLYHIRFWATPQQTSSFCNGYAWHEGNGILSTRSASSYKEENLSNQFSWILQGSSTLQSERNELSTFGYFILVVLQINGYYVIENWPWISHFFSCVQKLNEKPQSRSKNPVISEHNDGFYFWFRVRVIGMRPCDSHTAITQQLFKIITFVVSQLSLHLHFVTMGNEPHSNLGTESDWSCF
jgi:hypothetical protein